MNAAKPGYCWFPHCRVASDVILRLKGMAGSIELCSPHHEAITDPKQAARVGLCWRRTLNGCELAPLDGVDEADRLDPRTRFVGSPRPEPAAPEPAPPAPAEAAAPARQRRRSTDGIPLSVAGLVRACSRMGTLDTTRPGDFALEAPAGTVWKATGTHEVVAAEWSMGPGWRERLLRSLFKDAIAGTDPCTAKDCEWCAETKGAKP